jgi:ketosteroid isomerase-like protein
MSERILIHELLGRYYHCVDTKDVDGWLSLWTEDGLLSNEPNEARGTEQLTAFAREHIADPEKHTRHLVTNVFCDVDGDEADATSYMLVVDSDVQDAQRATAICRSRLTRSGGTWKLRSHVFKTDPSFDYGRLTGAPAPNNIAVEGEYTLYNDGEDLSPDVTIAKILGRDPENRAGLVEMQGWTYIRRNLQTGEFEASSNPELLGINGRPAGFFVLKGTGADVAYGVESARGHVNADQSVENVGSISVVGGIGRYRGATGVISFIERGRFTAAGYEGTLRTSGRIVLG